MMRLILPLILCGFFSFSAAAQIYYETKWQSGDVTYTGLMIYYDDNAATMRVKYTVDGKYKVAEFNCFGKTVSTAQGNVYLIDGQDAKIVYGEGETGYSADNFIFMDGIGDNAKPMHVDDNGVENIDDNLINVEYWRRVDTDQFTEQYVYNFYDRDESMYKVLLSYNQPQAQPAYAQPGGNSGSAAYYITESAKGGGEWGVVMSKGHPFSRQVITRSSDWPREWIQEKWDDEARITDLSYGDGKWAVTSSYNSGLTVQTWKIGDEWPNEWIQEKWDADYYITEATHGDKWALVMSKNTGFSRQTWKKSPTWPREWIKEKWDDGYKITAMDYGAGIWAVVMSKGSDYDTQTWKRSATYPREWIKEKWDEDYYISDLAYGEGEWSVIMNKGTDLTVQTWKLNGDYPTEWIKEKWGIGGGSGGGSVPVTAPQPVTSAPSGTRMHLIMVANSMIPDIGASCLIDQNTTTRELDIIAGELGIPLSKTIIAGQDFTKATVESTLNRLNPGSNDVVIFVYTGHGFRWSDQTSKYPTFDLRYSTYQSVSQNTSMNLADVYNTITAKGARLNLVLGDCCNSDIGVTGRGGQPSLASRRQAQGKIEKLRRLFLQSRGNLIGAAAQPNETACGSTRDGGYFISSFFAAISRETSVLNNDVADWENIIGHTINTARYKTQNLNGCSTQNGIYYSTIK